MFYLYDQNNSGGSFVNDNEKGIGSKVLIEAESERDADRKAEEIGIYFNGVEEGNDCECCGDRWSHACSFQTYESFEHFKKYYSDAKSNLFLWGNLFVHYQSGKIEKHNDKEVIVIKEGK